MSGAYECGTNHLRREHEMPVNVVRRLKILSDVVSTNTNELPDSRWIGRARTSAIVDSAFTQRSTE